MTKPKVAIVDNSVDVTGALNAILGYAEFAQSEFSFIFILPKNSIASEVVRRKGFKVFRISFQEIRKDLSSLLFYFPKLILNGIKLKTIVDKEKIAIVHVNDFYNLTGVMAKFLGGSFELVTHVRFLPDRFPLILVKTWLNLNLNYARAIIAVSASVKKKLPERDKVKLVYDGWSQIPKLRKFSKPNKEVSLLYLAHYIQGKGQDMALEAFSKAFAYNSNLRLRFVGGDMGLEKNKHYKNQLEKRVKELKLMDVVEVSGPVQDVYMELALADIVLNFSESESFSMTCLEALSSGVPLIASDCGGPAELFEHGISGLLVPNKDIDAMCNAILHLAADEKKRLKFSENSVNYVSKKFSPSVTFGRLRDLYKEVLFDS